MGTYMNTYIKKIISKIVSLVIAVAIMATALVGCGGDVNQTNDSLSILISKYSPIQESMISQYQNLYPNIKVNVIKKPEDITYGEFYKKISTELMAGKDPDIISLDNDIWSVLDGDKVLRSGLFENLNPYIEQDEDFNKDLYYDFVLDSGKLDGNQYVIPVYYDVPMLVTGDEMLKKSKLNIVNMTNFGGIKHEISSFYKRNTDIALVNDSTLDKDILFYSESELINYGLQEIFLDKDKFNVTSDIAKQVYKDSKSNVLKLVVDNTSALEYRNTLGGVVSSCEMISVSQPVQLIPIKNENGEIISKISSAIAINNSSKNKDNAYKFIRVVLDSLENKDTYYDSDNTKNNVISKKGMKYICEYHITANSPKVTMTFNGVVKEYDALPLDTKQVDVYDNIINNISKCSLFSNKGYDILYDEMLPYLKNEKSYEECIQSAQSKLEIYISE